MEEEEEEEEKKRLVLSLFLFVFFFFLPFIQAALPPHDESHCIGGGHTVGVAVCRGVSE